MSRRKQATKEAEGAAPEPSRTAGGCVLLGLAAIAVAALYAVSETALVLVGWAVGAAVLWRTVKRPTKIENHSPPPPRDPSRNTNTQFTVVEDRPGHCTINWQKEGA
ncbi:hypothetical protein ACFWHG_05775 [Streptomyces microflavus]|uniref:hypothetical protein n=1 Tax=Streptomyces microflavus TaxID=1919 RepID=UPI003663E4B7